jgi:quercetin dioxygenase-like cupin family protein
MRYLAMMAVTVASLGFSGCAEEPEAAEAPPMEQPATDAPVPVDDMMKVVAAPSLQWAPIQPEGFDPGMQIAVLYGDPAVPEQPYTIRLRFEDGYRFPAHYHPKTENLTVLSGTFLLEMGAEASENLKTYTAGDYLYLPPYQPHYGGAKGVTEIQLHGVGPFEIMLGAPPAA